MSKNTDKEPSTGLRTFLSALESWNPDEQLDFNFNDATETEKEFVQFCLKAKKQGILEKEYEGYKILQQLDQLFSEEISEEDCQERSNEIMREFLDEFDKTPPAYPPVLIG